MSYYHFQSKLRKKKSNKDLRPFISILLIAFGGVLFYFLVFHDKSGVVGKAAARIMFRFFGRISYIAALFLAYEGILLWKEKDAKKWRFDFALGSALFILFSGMLSFVSFILPEHVPNYGGVLGKNIAGFFRRLFGVAVGFIFNLSLFLYILSVLKKISFYQTLLKVYELLKKDIEEYRKVKNLSKKLEERVVRKVEAVKTKEIAAISNPGDSPAKEIKEEKTFTRDVSKSPIKPSPSEYNGYKIPPPDILSSPALMKEEEKHHRDIDRAQVLKKTLEEFGIKVDVGDIIPGPVITRYDLNLEAGTKYQSITALVENLALSLKASSIRVVPIPEKSAVGIEVPNPTTKIVSLKEIAGSEGFQKPASPLTFALGQTTDGASYVTDIIPMPHLLIAGATGSGKSVCIHTLILSILLKARPDEVKFILIDPKRLELPIYEGLPHLYDPSVEPEEARIITQPKKAMITLKQLVYIMEKRYELFAKYTVRNIDGFNEMAHNDPELNLTPVHYIVVIIDELADLMLISGKEIEDNIQRLAQMARAVGIHLVLATQRPSVDVITGVIKANFSARIAFQTTSKVDSRVILDTIGAEDLLGRGDMLFLPPGAPRAMRLQGSFVGTKDAESVIKFIRSQGFKPSYTEYIHKEKSTEMEQHEKDQKTKEYIASALKLINERRRVSQDLLKAHFGSSSRATDILSLLEKDGFIFKPEGTNRWMIHFDKVQDYLERLSDTSKFL